MLRGVDAVDDPPAEIGSPFGEQPYPISNRVALRVGQSQRQLLQANSAMPAGHDPSGPVDPMT